MSTNTKIEWTDATWNPIRGCSRVSEGCRHCYAETVANRFCGPGSPYEGLVQIGADGKGLGKWNGQIKFVEKRLLDPLRWKEPRRIFVNSMSDLFHENVTDAMLDKIFAVMALCPQHTFQVLTKRPKRMQQYLSSAATWPRLVMSVESVAKERWPKLNLPAGLANALTKGMPLPNVWLGVSVEDQKTAGARIPLLLRTPAASHFISAEPLLGPLDLGVEWLRLVSDAKRYPFPTLADEFRTKLVDLLDWVIVGGESGPGARPMHPDWARSLRDQCVTAGVPFFFKQWGEWSKHIDRDAEDADWRQPYSTFEEGRGFRMLNLAGGCGFHGERLHVMRRVGKKAAGHLLDGQEWHQFPEVHS